GAASAGNFASQWEIYKTSRELTELFAREGLKVEFFQGRGRGMDRGGTVDPSLQMKLMPPEVMCQGRYDVTLQSDLPMDLAASRSYGENYLTKTFISTLQAYVAGADTRKALMEMKGKGDVEPPRDSRESVFNVLAKITGDTYNTIVRKNPGALSMLNYS